MSRATALINGEIIRRPASAGALSFSMPSSSSRQNSNGQPRGLAANSSDDEQPVSDGLDGLSATAADDTDTTADSAAVDEIETVDGGEETEADASESDEAQSNASSTRNGSPSDAARAEFLQVLQRAKEGDRKAFEQIYQMYHRRIYNAVYGMLSDADDAQDVTDRKSVV